MTVRSVFTAPEVVQLINDLDYSRLDYWARMKVLVPSVMVSKGKGSRRLYSLIDIIALRVITKLRSEGVGLDRLRNIVKYLRRHEKELLSAGVDTRFITDGMNMFMLPVSLEEIMGISRETEIILVMPIGVMVQGLKLMIGQMLEKEEEKVV